MGTVYNYNVLTKTQTHSTYYQTEYHTINIKLFFNSKITSGNSNKNPSTKVKFILTTISFNLIMINFQKIH